MVTVTNTGMTLPIVVVFFGGNKNIALAGPTSDSPATLSTTQNKRKETITPFGIDFMRRHVLYWAAQEATTTTTTRDQRQDRNKIEPAVEPNNKNTRNKRKTRQSLLSNSIQSHLAV